MQLILVAVALAYIIGLYFMTNPLKHSKKFMFRRFMNWFPLGMTYSFMYMGRYNLNVAKNALGDVLSKNDFGFIGGVGFTVYAVSLFIVGPFVDRVGGKKGILIGAVGSSIINMIMGLNLYMFLNGTLKMNLVGSFSILYGLNMLFQSFGAVSTIKVKSFWFHVRERGTFGAIFGSLISLGVYFAFDWGEAIANAVKVEPGHAPNALHNFLNHFFALEGSTVPALWLIFVIPAFLMLVWAFLDIIILKDTPDDAGFMDFQTHDASHDEKHPAGHKFSYVELMKKIFTNKIILMIGVVELTSGVLKNGVLQWYKIYAKETHLGVEHITSNWGFWGCVTGIAGGFLAGLISDKFFHSRRAPSAGIMQVSMFVATTLMVMFISSSPIIVGVCSVTMMMSVIGVHSIMSGTATADFGGRKASATATGVADAFSYLGSAIQSFALGILTTKSWTYWPIFLVPFTLLGLFFAYRMWNYLPAATRKYLEEVEKKKVGVEV